MVMHFATLKTMSQPNECVPQGPLYGWSKVPTVSRGVDITDASLPSEYLNAPNNGVLYGTWPYVLAWAVVTADADKPLSASGGVVLRDIRTHVFRASTQKWDMLASAGIPNGGYLHNTADYKIITQGDTSLRHSGGLIACPPIGKAYEVWNSRALLPAGDFSALAVSVSVKLHPSTPKLSGFCVQCGADYYPWKEGSISGIVPGVATGRIIRADSEWRTATMFIGDSKGGSIDVPTYSSVHASRKD